MWRGLLILALALCLPGWATAAGGAPEFGADGRTLVLGSARVSQKEEVEKAARADRDDTLYDLLGREVQVFIYKGHTRVWPQPVGRGFWVYQRHFGSRHPDPRLDLLINKYAVAYGVDPALVRAVMRNESGFNPLAVSPKGAQGLMQLMPGTAALMGVQNPFDPEQSIAGGVGYLRHCLDRFGHSVPLALAAYNAGPDAVSRYCGIPPYLETQLYVNNVMGTYGAYGPHRGYLGGASWSPQMPANARPGSPPGKKTAPAAAKGMARKAGDAPRRPRAKIIEVRYHKNHIKAITRLKD